MGRAILLQDQVKSSEAIKLHLIDNGFLKWWFQADDVEMLEDSTASGLKMAWDVTAGIDIVIRQQYNMYGISCRMQPIKDGFKPYNTFSLRHKRSNGRLTELDKRKMQIASESIYPYLTIHGYYNSNGLLSLGCIKTKDLVHLVDSDINNGTNICIKKQGFDNDGVTVDFLAFPWNKVPTNIYSQYWTL
jgi:hypothetical protein